MPTIVNTGSLASGGPMTHGFFGNSHDFCLHHGHFYEINGNLNVHCYQGGELAQPGELAYSSIAVLSI